MTERDAGLERAGGNAPWLPGPALSGAEGREPLTPGGRRDLSGTAEAAAFVSENFFGAGAFFRSVYTGKINY